MEKHRDEKEEAARKFQEDLFTMRDIEKELKAFYEKTGYHTKDHAVSDQEFASFLNENYPEYSFLNLAGSESDINSLMEDQYIQEKYDISVVESLRYFPAIRHQHQFFELSYVLFGDFTNFAKDLVMHLGVGDILIMPPGSVHGICTYQDDGIMLNFLMRSSTFEQRFLGILPDDDLLRGFFSQALYKAPNTPYLLFHTGKDGREDPVLSELIHRLVHEYLHAGRYKNTMLLALMSAFFVALMRRHENDAVIPTMNASVMNENTIFILEYMQKNFSTITLKHLAAFFNYSERQMQRIILSATGCSFADNIKKIRMQKARALLSYSDFSVEEIAARLGYYDASSFRRAFRENCGMSPKKYREAEGKGELSL